MATTQTGDEPRPGAGIGGVPAESYSVPQVAKLFDLPAQRLRYWSRTGFVSPSLRRDGRAYYSFRDLIEIKVAKELLDGGLPLQRVRRSLDVLRTSLSEVEQPLSRLRIRCDHDRVLVDRTDHQYEATTGQLVLDFDVAGLSQQVAGVLALPWVGEGEEPIPDTAYEWFMHARELEQQWGGAPADQAGYEAACNAYRQALELDPDLAAAMTNLGSMLAERGDLDEAHDLFTRALVSDPDQPEAACNLAEVAVRRGDCEAAIAGYRHVLRTAPDHFDAHYGLARALLKVGGKGQALAHLERFVRAVDGLHPDARDVEVELRRDQALIFVARLRAELAGTPSSGE